MRRSFALQPLWPILWVVVATTMTGCTPKKPEIKPEMPTNLFDYSRLDLAGLLEFANRFGTLPDSARIAVCREMALSEKDGKTETRGLTLHQAAGQIFLSTCSDAPLLLGKLEALMEDSSLSAEQRQFASLAKQLIVWHDVQNNALIQAQKKTKPKASGAGIRRKPGTGERDPALPDEAAKPITPAPLADDVARKKLEALRNLEKSMDRAPTP